MQNLLKAASIAMVVVAAVSLTRHHSPSADAADDRLTRLEKIVVQLQESVKTNAEQEVRRYKDLRLMMRGQESPWVGVEGAPV